MLLKQTPINLVRNCSFGNRLIKHLAHCHKSNWRVFVLHFGWLQGNIEPNSIDRQIWPHASALIHKVFLIDRVFFLKLFSWATVLCDISVHLTMTNNQASNVSTLAREKTYWLQPTCITKKSQSGNSLLILFAWRTSCLRRIELNWKPHCHYKYMYKK